MIAVNSPMRIIPWTRRVEKKDTRIPDSWDQYRGEDLPGSLRSGDKPMNPRNCVPELLNPDKLKTRYGHVLIQIESFNLFFNHISGSV